MGRNGREPGIYCAGAADNAARVTSLTTTLQSFTFGGWAKLNTKAAASGHELVSKRQYYASAYTMFPFAISVDNTCAAITVMCDSGNDFSADFQLTCTVPGMLGRWFFYCASKNGNNVFLVVNGRLVGAGATSITLSAGGTYPYSFCNPTEYSGITSQRAFGWFGEQFIMNRGIPIAQMVKIYNHTKNFYRSDFLETVPLPAEGGTVIPLFQSNYSRRRRAA
jgi:hypothetical protein